MFDLTAFLAALAAIMSLGIASWMVSVVKNDVSIVDTLWSLMFLLAGVCYAVFTPQLGERALVVLVLLALWSLRLSIYITWRNWGHGEDYRYQEIRRNNEPAFWLKSLYIVFGLQGALAWLISLPLLGAIASTAPLNALDFAGIALWSVGMVFEAGGDFQLARFKANPENQGKVMDRGLWRYTRHPNYFGNACIWWGFYLVAMAGGAWWAAVAPLLMTFLLLKVSGVALLEKDITERRPAYRDYILRTNAFLPGPPRRVAAPVREGTNNG